MTQSTRKTSARDPLIAFRVPSKLRDEIRRVAKANDRNLSAEIRQAIREHVEREKAAV